MSRPLDILAQSGGWDFPRGRRGGSKDGLFSSLMLPPADSTRKYSSVKIMDGNFWEVWKRGELWWVGDVGWEHWSPGKLERLGEVEECRRRGKEGEQVALVLSALHHGAPFRLYTVKSEKTPWNPDFDKLLLTSWFPHLEHQANVFYRSSIVLWIWKEYKVGWQIFSLQSTNTCSSLVLNSSCLICGILASFIWILFWKLRLEMIVQMCTAVMSVYLWCVLAEMSSSWVERVPVLDLILQGHLSTWEPERVPTGSHPSRTPATNNFPMKRECWFCRDWD